jgi:TRAP-type uncharacterized transport system substrate-binding protein
MRKVLGALAAGFALWGAAAQAHFITIGSWKAQTAEEQALIGVISAISANDRMPANIRMFPGPREALLMVGLGGLEFAVIDLERARHARDGTGPFAGTPNPGLRLIAVLGSHAIISNNQVFDAMDHHLASLVHLEVERFAKATEGLAGLAPADLVPAAPALPWSRGAERYWREVGLLP